MIPHCPVALADLHREAQIAQDMDGEVNVAGNGICGSTAVRLIEEVCWMLGQWLPPRLTNETAIAYLVATGREAEVEYLMGELG